MDLKGANPGYEGEAQPDRWSMDEHLTDVAARWRIAPDRDLVPVAAR
jgi:hypothetical protein